MDNISDIQRSFLQYQKHKELGYLKLTLLHKIMLSTIFFLLLPFVVFNIFLKKKKNTKDVFVVDYGSKQPYKIINQELKATNRFKFLRLNSFYIPLLPTIFIIDIFKNPIFTIKNLPFWGGLLLKISKYYFFIKYNNISKLIVLQEYSFYISYLTRVMEIEGGGLYNIQHGIPGKTYSYFRFTKSFIWSDYFKDRYLKYGADKNQFIISGSIFHHFIIQNKTQQKEEIDILYTLDGSVARYEDIFVVLEQLSSIYRVRIKQHPRDRVINKYNLIEIDEDIIESIQKSKIIIGHYTTALLDAIVLEKRVVSYLGGDSSKVEYVNYLSSSQIIYDRDSLESYLINILENSDYINPNIDTIIDMSKNPIEVIIDEIY